MNILIVEDNKEMLAALLMTLKKAGHVVTGVGEVLPAFEILKRRNTDLILMDIGLPGLDGLKFTRKLKRYSHLKDIPIIAITGTPQDFLENSALRAGCSAYLEKPVDTKRLLELLSSLQTNQSDQTV